MTTWNEKFVVSEYLGRGAFTIVFDVKSTCGADKGEHYALKRFLLKEPNAVRNSLRELKILQRIANEKPDCKQLASMHYSFIHSGSPCIVMKLLSRHTLLNLLSNVFYLTEYDVVFYAAEILHGLDQLHSMNIVHMDIRQKNIIFTESGHLVISDFDRAIDLSAEQPYDNLRFILLPHDRAPEIKSNFRITTQADIWSFGIVLEEMVNAMLNPSPSLKNLIDRCLIKCYYKRFSAERLKRHQVFKCIKWDCIAAWSYPPPLLPSSLPYEFGDEVEQLKEFLKYDAAIDSTPELREKPIEVQNQAFLTECAFGQSMPCISRKQMIHLNEDGTELKGVAIFANSDFNREESKQYVTYFKEYQSTNPIVKTEETET
ncbi:unnamed protein product [Rodentolepis nana]|uniref:Protein kinase domain-containing protein n=1 Tax=Rodentolepis nana TaxID=102285 RepID=A0A0R3TLC7_RODNA|nr:unnamed protein product [Rodentolepis nana]